MKSVTIDTNHTRLTRNEFKQVQPKIDQEISIINQAAEGAYDVDQASINLALDKEALQAVQDCVQRKNKLNPSLLVVVGIGGSNLGTLACCDAILGKKHNLKNPERKIVFADTVDADLLFDTKQIIENELNNHEKILLNVVSKSGSTTETIANFEVLLQQLEEKWNNPDESIVVTTDYQSKLWNIAEKKGYDRLQIPQKVGGRFSVFSPVGLFPLAMMDIDIASLLNGAEQMRTRCLQSDGEDNPAAMAAASSFLHYQKGHNIHDLFLFSDDLESIGKWYRQLVAESIGKQYDRDQKEVFTGVTPTYSIGSTDLHSVGQLYLGGPFDKFTTFVPIGENKHTVMLPDYDDYAQLVNGIQNRSLQEIMDAIYQGVKTAFMKGNRAFMEVMLPDKSEASLGQFLQLNMMHTMMLGGLLNINPFNQPNVEAYKKETRAILEK